MIQSDDVLIYYRKIQEFRLRIGRAKKGEQKAKLNLRKCGVTDDIVSN